ERMKETHVHGSREGKSFTIDRQIEPLVMDSEIKGLADLHTFVKLGNYVSRFSFPHTDLPTIAPGFIPRESGAQMEWLELPNDAAAQTPPAGAVFLQDPEAVSPAPVAPLVPAEDPSLSKHLPETKATPPALTPELQARMDAFLAEFERRRLAATLAPSPVTESQPDTAPSGQQTLFPEPPTAEEAAAKPEQPVLFVEASAPEQEAAPEVPAAVVIASTPAGDVLASL
ncbi:MAG: hypothetical protein ACRYFU_04255, partial [Janthinobacterium lividum]